MIDPSTLISITGAVKILITKPAINDITINLSTDRKIAVMGETGSGKSTFLKLIAGLEQLDAGHILYKGEKIKGPNETLIAGHPKIAYLSQHFELRNNYKIHEILSYANEMSEMESSNLYELCRINHLFDRWTDELSGGEKQRVALAKLLTAKPDLLLLDEPFSNLDYYNKNIIKQVINDLMDMLKISCIMVSHDSSYLLSWADDLIILKDGKIEQFGNPIELYHQPLNKYCANVLGEYQLLDYKSTFFQWLLPLGNHSEKRQMLIRPNYFSFNTSTNNSIKGIVQEINHRPNYNIVTVSTHDQLIDIATIENTYTVGELVSFSFNRNTAWFI